MKKLLAATSLFLSFGVISGEAVIPYWSTYSAASSCFSLSNISASTVTFKFELFDSDGNTYSGGLDFPKNITALNQDTTLGAKKSAEFCLAPGANKFGYGLITTNSSPTQGEKFVVARGFGYRTTDITRGAEITINNGLPF